MMPRSEALALIAIAGLCVIGIVILAALKVTVPGTLGDLAFAATGAGAGASLPRFLSTGLFNTGSANTGASATTVPVAPVTPPTSAPVIPPAS